MKHTHQSVQARIAELVSGVSIVNQESLDRAYQDFLDTCEMVVNDNSKTQARVAIAWDRVRKIAAYTHELLNRDATLADVLRAIGSKNQLGMLKVNCLGGFTILESEREHEQGTFSTWKDIAMPRWNLSLPLSGQSQEVIDFIGELLS